MCKKYLQIMINFIYMQVIFSEEAGGQKRTKEDILTLRFLAEDRAVNKFCKGFHNIWKRNKGLWDAIRRTQSV